MDNKQKEKENAYFSHLIRYQKLYLPLLLVLISAVIIFSNYLHHKPLLMGGESYYYLSLARGESPYHPLTLLFKLIPEQAAFLFPPLLSLASIFLFYALSKRLNLSEKKVFFIILAYLLTPTFVLASLTISAYLLYLFLVMAGTYLLLSSGHKKYLALIPFALASCIDTFTALMLLAGISAYYFLHHQSKEPFPIFLTAIIASLIVLNFAVLQTPLFLGPYLSQKLSIDFISDLGAFSGVGFFVLLLALIGIVVSWEKKTLLIMGPALAVFITAYLLNTQTVFFLSLFMIIFAAVAIEYLLEQQWRLSFLRNAVLLLLILGISFSTVSYLDRVSDYSPTAVDRQVLRWIEEETDDEAIILSAPENSYYVSYFAKRKPALNLHHDYREQHALSENIFSAFYIDELFPLLEASDVSIIYVSEEMRHTLPKEQEFFFLLQNERFKLLNSTGEAEVWSFEEAKK